MGKRDLLRDFLILGDGEAEIFRSLDDPVGGLAGDDGAAERLDAAAPAIAENLHHAGRQMRQALAAEGDAVAGQRQPDGEIRSF